MLFNIESSIQELSKKRKLFTSEADLQLELGWIIKEMYPSAKVRMEYCPEFKPDMHIDILVIWDGKWIPIELKYKTKGCMKRVDGDTYILKNHSAKDVNCYLYLKDIMRIEEVREKQPAFIEGYTILITNESSYLKKPSRPDCVYAEFSLEQGAIKHGEMFWGKHASAGTMKGCEQKIQLTGNYPIEWHTYSEVDNSASGKFYYLINTIKRI